MSKRIIIAPDFNGDDELQFYEDNVLQGTLKMVNQVFIFSRPISDGGKYSHETITNGSSSRIIIGDKRFDRTFFIDYAVERGGLFESGSLNPTNNETDGPFPFRRFSSGDDCGISFAFTVDENSIIMTATLTSVTSDGELKITTKTIAK